MSETGQKVKKYVVIGGVGIVGILLLQRVFSGGSSSQGSNNMGALAQLQAQGMAYNLQNAQLQQAARRDEAQIAATNAALAIRNTEAQGQVVSQIGNAIAGVTLGQSQIPVAAMQAAAAGQQAALMSAAGVASSGMRAASEGINSAANLTFASYAPLLGYGSALAGLGAMVGMTSMTAINGVGFTAGSAVNAMSGVAQGASAANAQATGYREASRASQVDSVADMFGNIFTGGMSSMGGGGQQGGGGGGGFNFGSMFGMGGG